MSVSKTRQRQNKTMRRKRKLCGNIAFGCILIKKITNNHFEHSSFHSLSSDLSKNMCSNNGTIRLVMFDIRCLVSITYVCTKQIHTFRELWNNPTVRNDKGIPCQWIQELSLFLWKKKQKFCSCMAKLLFPFDIKQPERSDEILPHENGIKAVNTLWRGIFWDLKKQCYSEHFIKRFFQMQYIDTNVLVIDKSISWYIFESRWVYSSTWN